MCGGMHMETLAMAEGINQHMDDDQIERYSMGSLSEEEAERFSDHLMICESCQKRVAESDIYVAAMTQAAGKMRRAPRRNKTSSAFWLGGAVFAVVAVTALLLPVASRLRHLSAPMPVRLEAMRGAVPGSTVPVDTRLLLVPDLSDLPVFPVYRLELVDSIGNRVWDGNLQPQESAPVTLSRVGTYFARVYSTSGVLLREYGLQVSAR